MPPIKTENVRELKRGTVRLSSPKGERVSAKTATRATANAARIELKRGRGYNIEKKARLTAKLRKLARNMAIDPSTLFVAKTW